MRRFVVGSRGTAGQVSILPLPVADEIRPGDSLSAKLLAAAKKQGVRFQARDILVVKHKVVSKAEGALVALDDILPSAASRVWARRYGLDARVTELDREPLWLPLHLDANWQAAPLYQSIRTRANIH